MEVDAERRQGHRLEALVQPGNQRKTQAPARPCFSRTPGAVCVTGLRPEGSCWLLQRHRPQLLVWLPVGLGKGQVQNPPKTRILGSLLCCETNPHTLLPTSH